MSKSIIDKNKGVINVQDFGALGDGTTDDTAAIKAAINAAHAYNSGTGVGVNRRPIHFPPGNYCFNQQLVFDKITVTGAGWRSTVLTLKTSVGDDVPAIVLTKGSWEDRTWFRDIQIRCAVPGITKVLGTKPTDCNGIQINGSTNLERIMVRGFNKGIVMNTDHNNIDTCFATENYFGVYLMNCQGDQSIQNSVITGNMFAAIGCWRMRDTLIYRTHLGYSPYGIYQVPFTTQYPADFIMYDARILHVSFEGCGNAAIYSENWQSTGVEAGILNCRFERVGYSCYTSYRLLDRSYDYTVKVGYCSGTNYYYPGAAPFSVQPGGTGVFYVNKNYAVWRGNFQYGDFTITDGYKSGLYPDLPLPITTNGSTSGTITCNLVKHNATRKTSYDAYATLYLYFDSYVGTSGTPQSIALPPNFKLPGDTYNKAPMVITVNSTALANSAIVINYTSQTITVTPPDGATYTGFVKIEGAVSNYG